MCTQFILDSTANLTSRVASLFQELKTLIPDQVYDRCIPREHGLRPATSERTRQSERHAVISDDEAQSECLEEHLTSDLLRFLEDHVDESSRRVREASSTAYSKLLDHFSDTSAKLTVAFSNISGSHISWDEDTSSRGLSSKSLCNALQPQRALSLPHAKHTGEKELLEMQQECKCRHEDLMGYAKECVSATVEEVSGVFRFVVMLTVSVVLVPWVLFVGLYLLSVLVEIPGWLETALLFLIP